MKNFLLNIFFPKFCLGCQKEGTYLCQDCQALIDISSKIFYQNKELSRLYFATDYKNFVVKRLIQKFKYEPFAKSLSQALVSLIIIYFQNLENPVEFLTQPNGFILTPVPLSKKRLRWRGFNQTKEIAHELSQWLKIPVFSDVLSKSKDTIPQLTLPQEARKENVRGAFFCKEPGVIKNKIVLLVDDVFTTGATMEETAKTLKQAGAKDIWGIVVARG